MPSKFKLNLKMVVANTALAYNSEKNLPERDFGKKANTKEAIAGTSYDRDFPNDFTTARGAQVFDKFGQSWIDFFAGAGSMNYGHNNPVIKNAAMTAMSEDLLMTALGMSTAFKKKFLDVFYKNVLEPRRLSDMVSRFVGPTGEDAVEVALKYARINTGRDLVAACTNSFHGMSLGALAATSSPKFRMGAGQDLSNTVFIPFSGAPERIEEAFLKQNYSDLLDGKIVNKEHRSEISDQKNAGYNGKLPAALILETVQGEGGINIAQVEWLKRIERICKNFEIALIIDEIQTGVGRTGPFFSFERAGIKPDIVCASKSIGAGFPLSMVLLRPDFDKDIAHSGTFRGNSLAFVAGEAALSNYWQNDQLEQNTVEKHKIVMDYLHDIQLKYPDIFVDLRGEGLMIGLEAKDADIAETIRQQCYLNGLLMETSGGGKVLKFMPPLTIENDLLLQGLEIFNISVEEIFN